MRCNARNRYRFALEFNFNRVTSHRAGGMGAVTVAVFRGDRFSRIVIGVGVSAYKFVITSSGIVWITTRGTNAQVIALPFVDETVSRSSTERGVIEVDTTVDHTNQDAFTLIAIAVRDCSAVPDTICADPFGASICVESFDRHRQDPANASYFVQ